MFIFQKYIHVHFIMGLWNNGFKVEFFYVSSSCDFLNNTFKKNQNIEYVKMFQKFSKFFTTIFLNF